MVCTISAHQVEVFSLHDLDVPKAALELAPQHGVYLVLLSVLRGILQVVTMSQSGFSELFQTRVHAGFRPNA